MKYLQFLDLSKGTPFWGTDFNVLNISSQFLLSERLTTLKFSPKLCYNC